MKLTKILMCAMAVGAMAFVSNKAQALVIEDEIFVPLNIKVVVNVVKSDGQLQQKSGTSKTIVNDLGYANGTLLAVGPSGDIYAIYKGVIQDDLSAEGKFYFNTDEFIYTVKDNADGSSKSAQSGIVTLDFADLGDLSTLDNNDVAFNLTGAYTLTGGQSAVKNGYLNESVKYKTSSLSDTSYIYGLDEVDILPMTGSASGGGSGKLVP